VARLVLVVLALMLLAVACAGPTTSPTPASPSPSAAPGASASPGASVTPAPAAGASASPAAPPTRDPNAPPCPNPSGGPAPTPVHNLCPAQPGSDPFALLSWIFTPIFQTLFLGLVFFYKLTGDIGLAIIALTIVIRLLLVPVFRRQIVSQRRMQLLQPELRALQQKYRGDRQRVSQEQMNLYKERGVNPASGCLPAVLTMFLLIPMYSVFSQGLTAPDISSMLQVFGSQVMDVACQAPGTNQPCIDPTVHWLPDIRTGQPLKANLPEILFHIPLPFMAPFGVSLLALISALLQLVQTRMMSPQTSDPQVQAQQRIFLILPLFSIFYGSFLPAGLFIYWIVTTIFAIVQQYLIAGWGSLFPLFGWTPGFARDHSPRFPVPPPPPLKRGVAAEGEPPPTSRRSPSDRAAGTVRPNRQRGRTSRRGRRR
jgi:YidC/Oxa1 family membrane protein insertase